MGSKVRYISVILPLKLVWEPYYSLPEGIEAVVGDRVRVLFAGRLYLGVVSATDVVPSAAALPRIRDIKEIVGSKERIAPTEIAFWRQLAVYYMCSVGEVFKAAYTSAKDKEVKTKKQKEPAPKTIIPVDVSGNDEDILTKLAGPVKSGQKVLLESGNQEILLAALCQRYKNANVLWLLPEKKFEKNLSDLVSSALGDRLVLWDSSLTPAQKRRAAERVRSGQPYLVLGTRSALFLPHSNLGLVIVQDEHEASYKQNSPAPRYNGRDAALILASIFNASCVLTSCTPSLESVHNCLTGKYVLLSEKESKNPEYLIVDTRAESRKNGMIGEVSRRLANAASVPFAAFKPRRAAFPKLEDIGNQLNDALGKEVFLTDDMLEKPVPDDIELLAVFGTDAMLGRQDFRADERVFQMISQAVSLCPPSLKKVVIQTREPAHSVFATIASGDLTPLLEERKRFSLPPYTRLLDVLVQDTSEERQHQMCCRLRTAIEAYAPVIQGPGILRVTLSKDRKLPAVKKEIKSAVEACEMEEKYAGHIYFDVDPVI